jgi:hypothetical protein
MTLIPKREVDRIIETARKEVFPEKKTDYYWWYARYIWFALALMWAIGALCFWTWDDRVQKGIILCGTLGLIHHLNWLRMRERFALKTELERREHPAGGDAQ